MEARINLFKQIRAYYSFIFNSDKNFTPTHSSLYMFLLNQNNRANWVEWFKCPADTAMFGALINSNKTYYKTLNELVEFGLIEVQKGINNFKAPKIKIIKLKYEKESKNPEIQTPEQIDSSVNNTTLLAPLLTQLPTLVLTQLSTQLSTLLPTLKDKPNTKILITIKKRDELDFSFISEDFLPIVEKWLQYKSERKENYKTSGFKQLYEKILKLSNNNPTLAEQIINESMANNYAGIFPLKQVVLKNDAYIKPIVKPTGTTVINFGKS